MRRPLRQLAAWTFFAVSWSVIFVGLYASGEMRYARGQELLRAHAHVGSPVVFIHYHWGYEGQPRAAKLLEAPRTCPGATLDHPGSKRVIQLAADAEGCANIRFWTVSPSETENPTNVLDANGVATTDYTRNGDDFRFNVPHDPTGKTPRTWHLWGEAPGEED